MATKPQFTVASFGQRLLFSSAVVFVVYNPSGYSVAHWIARDGYGPASAKAAVVIALAIVYVGLARIVFATFRWTGLAAAVAFAALLSFDVVHHVLGDDSSASPWERVQYIALMALAVVLGFGLSWSAMMRQLTGQLAKWYVR